jgi:hypothetical protein
MNGPSHKSSVENMVVSAIKIAIANFQKTSEGEQKLDDLDNETTRQGKATVGQPDAVVSAGSSATASRNTHEATRLVRSEAGMDPDELGDNDGQVRTFISMLISCCNIEYVAGCSHGNRPKQAC